MTSETSPPARAEPREPAVASVLEALERALDRDPARTASLAESLAAALKPFAAADADERPPPLRPLVAPRGRADQLARAVTRTALDITRALERRSVVMSLPGLADALRGSPPPVRSPEVLDVLRVDGALAEDGAFTATAFHAGSCVGGLVEVERVSDVMAAWYGDAAPVRWPRPATDVARALVRRYGRDARCAWVASPGDLGRNDGAAALAEGFARICRAEGLRCEPVEVDGLVYDGRSVSLGGANVDVLLRRVAPVEWLCDERLGPLRDAVLRRHVKLFVSPYDLLFNHRAALAVLSKAGHDDPRGAVIPWTRFAGTAEDDGADLDAARVDDGVVQRKVAAPRATLPFYTEGTLTRRETEVTVSPVVVRGAEGTLCASASGVLPVVEPRR